MMQELVGVDRSEWPGLCRSGRIGLTEAVVAHAYGVALDEMRSRSRKRNLQEARQVAIYLMRIVFEIGPRALARETGRSPATAVHACQRIEALRERPDFDRTLDFLEQQLRLAAGAAA